MTRAVVDTNVLISAVLSPKGAPAAVLAAAATGAFRTVVSPGLLDELERALAYEKIRVRVAWEESTAFVAELRRIADIVADPRERAPDLTRDPKDDYLIALAREARADFLVSGDRDLLAVAGAGLTILAPHDFLASILQGE